MQRGCDSPSLLLPSPLPLTEATYAGEPVRGALIHSSFEFQPLGPIVHLMHQRGEWWLMSMSRLDWSQETEV